LLHSPRRWFAGATLAAISLAAPRSGAQTEPPGVISDTLRLTLAESHALALRANPQLRAERLEAKIAKANLQQAGVFFRSNPTIDVLAGGPGTEVGLGQEIEIAGQRGARRAAAIAGVDRAEAGILDTTRLTVAAVDRNYFRLVSASQKFLLAQEGRLLTERLADAARRQLEAGKISRLEYNLSAVEAGRARARSLSAAREQAQFASELRELLGLPPSRAIAPVAPSTAGESAATLDVDSLTAMALARRPDLSERAAAARQARAFASTARREALPNLSIRASSERIEGTEGRALRPGIGLSLPIFNRNTGEVRAREAEAQKIDLQRVALLAKIRTEVARAVLAYQSAEVEARMLDSTVLAPARENRRLLEVAYREGKVGLPVVLLIRNQVVEAEMEYWNAWLAAREALIDLRSAIGDDATVAAAAEGHP